MKLARYSGISQHRLPNGAIAIVDADNKLVAYEHKPTNYELSARQRNFNWVHKDFRK